MTDDYIGVNRDSRHFAHGGFRLTKYFSRVDRENFALKGTWGDSELVLSGNGGGRIVYLPRKPGPLLKVLPHRWRGAYKFYNTAVVPNKLRYRLGNEGNEEMQYSVSSSQNWLTINDPGGGRLAPGKTVDIEFQFNSNADSLAVGKHKSTVTFKNLTNDGGSAKRIIRIFVGSVPADVKVTSVKGIHCDKKCWLSGNSISDRQETEFTYNSGPSHSVKLLKTEPWIQGGISSLPSGTPLSETLSFPISLQMFKLRTFLNWKKILSAISF